MVRAREQRTKQLPLSENKRQHLGRARASLAQSEARLTLVLGDGASGRAVVQAGAGVTTECRLKMAPAKSTVFTASCGVGTAREK